MFIIVCIILLPKEVVTVNVALNTASSKFCDKRNATNSLFDGNQYILSEFISEPCIDSYEFNISLNGSYFIHYVIIYAGKSMENDKIKLGATIMSHKFNGDKKDCGSYVRVHGNIESGGLRINCKEYSSPSEKLLFETETPLYIAEIEAHTLASGKPGEDVLIYRGCFKNFTTFTKVPLVGLLECQRVCSSDSFVYAGIKDNSECHCSKEFDETGDLLDSHCNLECSKVDGKICGGQNAYSVYLLQVQLPSIEGCGAGDYTVQKESNDMTINFCLQFCDDKYNFALITKGKRCACGKDYLRVRFGPNSDCSVLCAGSSKEYCGGENHWTVYRTCLSASIATLPCSTLFRCTNWNKYGVCDDCEEHYGGEHCMERIPEDDSPFVDIFKLIIILPVIIIIMIIAACLLRFDTTTIATPTRSSPSRFTRVTSSIPSTEIID